MTWVLSAAASCICVDARPGMRRWMRRKSFFIFTAGLTDLFKTAPAREELDVRDGYLMRNGERVCTLKQLAVMLHLAINRRR